MMITRSPFLTDGREFTTGSIRGATGPQGPAGPQGIQGEQGPQGLQGIKTIKYTRADKIDMDQVYGMSSIEQIIINSIPSAIKSNSFRNASNLTDIYVPWSEGEVANAPWGATNATIHYNTVYDANGDPIT